jgi:4-methyl-5(b-hydroxyethyl)-thiazole monophosphate biosynthesis
LILSEYKCKCKNYFEKAFFINLPFNCHLENHLRNYGWGDFMKKILVPLAEGFEEIEAITTIDVLRRAGLDVVSAGLPGTIVKGSRNVKVLADRKIEDIDSKEFDCVVLPGGDPGYVNLSRSSKVKDILREFDEQKKLICAICASPSILGKLGILNEKKATIYPGMEREIPRPRDEKVVVDGHVITSQGPGTAMDFALKIIEKTLGEGKAKEVKDELLHR